MESDKEDRHALIVERLKRYKEEEEKEQKILLWRDIDAMEFPNDRWRVRDLIPKDGMTILASISGEGKTWTALSLARDISLGKDFLGQERFKTVQGKVLYMDAENALSEIQRRCRQLSFTDTDQLLFKPVDQLNLNDEDKVLELIELVRKEGIKVVIIDTFRALAGGLKEERAEEVRAFFSRFKELKGGEISIVWLDHYRKPSNFEGRVPKKEFLFGSQDKTANIETLLMMKKEEDDITVYQRKNRLGKEIPAFKMTIMDHTDEDGSTKTLIEFGGEIDEKESKKDIAKEFIPNILADGPRTTPELEKITCQQAKVGGRNVRDALGELYKENVVGRRRRGKPYEYFLITNKEDLGQSDTDKEFNSF